MVTYTREEKQAIMKEYKNSGKSLKGFTEEKGIPPSTLQGWIKEDQNLTFGAIEVKASTSTFPKTIKPATVFATEKMKFQWTRNKDEMHQITKQQLNWLLSGLKIYPEKYFKDIDIEKDKIAI